MQNDHGNKSCSFPQSNLWSFFYRNTQSPVYKEQRTTYITIRKNPDSNAIIQKLSEQCQEFQGNITSETESEISNS